MFGQDEENADVIQISRRMRMVDEQIAGRGILDTQVLNAMRTVPRHHFVPKEFVDKAYEDSPLSIGEEQTISQPYIVGSMTEELELTNSSKVLEIGTGSGYQTAILAEIAALVCSIEIIPSLLIRATTVLAQLEYSNIKSMLGDGTFGWSAEAPFDAIIVTAAAPEIPDSLISQLAENGNLVIPLKKDTSQQGLWKIRKVQGGIDRKSLYPVRFVPMRGGIER